MKITFYSNFLNHHQLPICLSFYEKFGGDFTFVADMSTAQEQLKLGYEDMNKKYPFVLTTYDSEENQQKALFLAAESDVVIHASDEIYIVERMKHNKLTFRYSERIYKRGKWRALSPRGFPGIMKNHIRYRTKNLNMLCASGYTSADFALWDAYKDKCYKWGYFPNVKKYNIDILIKDKSKDKISILWCARFLDWKHPEKALYVAKKLKQDGYNFELKMIGNGELFDKIATQVANENLQDVVYLIGSVDAEKVRKYMERANIFLFTSDFNEGWGAVLNESMNSGCAVVASHAIGSVPFLMKDEQNGLIYKNSSNKHLYQQVKRFMDDKSLREFCGRNGYDTIKNIWSPENACRSFIELCNKLLENQDSSIIEGPCSKADYIKNRWFQITKGVVCGKK